VKTTTDVLYADDVPTSDKNLSDDGTSTAKLIGYSPN
jgi:hypothetical protein